MGKSKSKHKNKVKFDQNKLKFYYGIPHCHSAYSTGKGTPLDLYEFATDHNDYLSILTSIIDNVLTRWDATNYYANKIRRSKDDFLPLVGFECRTFP